MELIDFLAYLLVITQLMMLVAGIGFLISGLDDLFIDIVFVLRSLYRKSFLLSRFPKIGEQRLNEVPEKPMAVMIPAWDESAVIGSMLRHTLRTMRYTDFTIFVGVYPNDLATIQEVDSVCTESSRVKKIVTSHPGPTNKADCLNHIFRGIVDVEQQNGLRHEIFVMQDCEDVIHPFSYKLFNYLIPRKDMVQIPVEGLHSGWHKLTAGHYLDEFAQSHYKDMVVREALGGGLPAAGVGAAFSRRALEALAAQRMAEPFSTQSLTEDYEFGFRLHELKLKQAFVRFSLPRTIVMNGRTITRSEVLSVREYFPDHPMASIRQKSRWVLGIALQGWASIGWRGGLATRYMLFRDRKAIFTNLLNMVGYLIVVVTLCILTLETLAPDSVQFPSIVESGSLLWFLLIINLVLFTERIAMRAFCVLQVHGPLQALLSFPRMIWGNFINFFASCRALWLYGRHLLVGDRLHWDKTHHRYPDSQSLTGFTRRIGDVLLDQKLITAAQLAQALDRQQTDKKPLGELLTDMGFVNRQQISAALMVR
jgi:adsorption protein B